MKKAVWRGNIHGVLRWPKARHRPARIFRRRRRRPSPSTLHRPPCNRPAPPSPHLAAGPRTQTSIASQAEAKGFCLREKGVARASRVLSKRLGVLHGPISGTI